MLRPLSLGLAALLGLSIASGARAEAPGDFAAAMGLTTSDGSVRTQAGVKFAVSGISGRGDYMKVMSSELGAQLPSIRRCFAEAMSRDIGVQGKVSFEVEALARGKARASVAANETNDGKMVSCMDTALEGANLKGAPAGARALVALELNNPSASLKETMRRGSSHVPFTVLGGGMAQTESATQQGEVKVELRASAYARELMTGLHQDLQGRLAGLLDCRRKASRRGKNAEGTISLELKLEKGKIAKIRTAANGVGDRNAPACVTAWLAKTAPDKLQRIDAALDITFSP